MNTRIRELRETKKLSRVAFGELLGVSGDVINNLERGRVDIKDNMIKLICSTFNVSEDWIRTGDGSMFLPTLSTTMEQLKKEYDMTSFDTKLVCQYLKLSAEKRAMVRDFFDSVNDANCLSQEFTPSDMTAEQLHSELDRQISLEQRAMEKSVV